MLTFFYRDEFVSFTCNCGPGGANFGTIKKRQNSAHVLPGEGCMCSSTSCTLSHVSVMEPVEEAVHSSRSARNPQGVAAFGIPTESLQTTWLPATLDQHLEVSPVLPWRRLLDQRGCPRTSGKNYWKSSKGKKRERSGSKCRFIHPIMQNGVFSWAQLTSPTKLRVKCSTTWSPLLRKNVYNFR